LRSLFGLGSVARVTKMPAGVTEMPVSPVGAVSGGSSIVPGLPRSACPRWPDAWLAHGGAAGGSGHRPDDAAARSVSAAPANQTLLVPAEPQVVAAEPQVVPAEPPVVAAERRVVAAERRVVAVSWPVRGAAGWVGLRRRRTGGTRGRCARRGDGPCRGRGGADGRGGRRRFRVSSCVVWSGRAVLLIHPGRIMTAAAWEDYLPRRSPNASN
jgi:hypothetical protein